MNKIKYLLILSVVLLYIVVPPVSRGFSVKCVRVFPTTASLITMLQPGLDPELAAVHAKYIDKNTQLWGVDRFTFVSMINLESGFDSMAESSKGAKGASQILVRVHKELLKKRRILPSEVFYLDNNYSMGCEILHNAKDKSHNLDETLTRYVGGYCPGYIPKIKKDIGRCKAMISSNLVISDKG
jgi:soluble lytic murein transglycosylase-like protein